MNNRAGCLVTNLSGEMAYQSFRPNPLPPEPPIEMSNELIAKLIEAGYTGWPVFPYSEYGFVCFHVCAEGSTAFFPDRRDAVYAG